MRISTHGLSLLSLLAVALVSFSSLSSATTLARQASISTRSSKLNGGVNEPRTRIGRSVVDMKQINKTKNLVAALSRGGAVDPQTQAIAGAVVLGLIEQVVKKGFGKFKVNFPSQLGGCMILLSFMLLAEGVMPGWGESIYEQLAPGAGLLAKWLPSFFVPGLAMLPLAPAIGNGAEV